MMPPEPGPGEPIVALDQVSRLYTVGASQVRALDQLSFSFAAGSFWAIMGPSGSGKSTLLALLGCLDRPSSGSLRIQGQDTRLLADDQLAELRSRHLGFVFQSFHLIPQLTVRENIELPLLYRPGGRAPVDPDRLARLVAALGLADRLHHRPAELSGGQQQRVAIARALMNDPAIILADEPTGNLDTATGAQIMDLFLGLHRQGKTVLMVTHEPEVAAMAQARLHLRDGRLDRIE
ncbi:MAG: ABC transporter ATP-binding protein [Thermodesulfobacteriota bacterium]